MAIIHKLRSGSAGDEPKPRNRYVGPLPVTLIALAGILLIGVIGLYQGEETPYRYAADRHVAERLEAHLPELEVEEAEAALRGALWTVRFVQPDAHFDQIFSDYLLMLHELYVQPADETVRRCLHDLILNALQRAEPRLAAIFPSTPYGAWDFQTILRILWEHEGPVEAYEGFYREVLSGHEELTYDTTFEEALQARDYDTLCDYLIDAAFLHYLREERPEGSIALPPDRLPHYIRELAHLEYVHTVSSKPEAYQAQNYFATHVILVLSDYGSKRVLDCKLADHALRYVQEEFEPVWRRVPDMDLLAEFIHCLKIARLDDQTLVDKAARHLLDLQRPDGSWGSDEDLAGSPYQAFHPTWTVATALNYVAPTPRARP
jgi:hypothetical protein